MGCLIMAQGQVAVSDSPTAGVDVGLDGACMHGDIHSSDSTRLPGPGVDDVDITAHQFMSACPTVLIRSDGYPFALCMVCNPTRRDWYQRSANGGHFHTEAWK